MTTPESVTSIGEYAFYGCSNIAKVVSLNPIPPVIDSSTFNSNIGESASLFVPKGSLVKYWADPVWKNFINISDNMLFLQAIPDVRYGESEIDLSQYAPEGVALTYTSSNEDVVKINGTTMQIVGAGTATVAAILEEEGSMTELVGQMRRIFVDQADLIVTVEDIVIKEGEPVPDFTYLAEGLQYDDTLDDIEKLPVPLYDVDENSPAGEYKVRFTEGSDHNYRIATKPAKITVTINSEVNGIAADAIGTVIEVYDLDGRLLFRGERADAHLAKGIYIIRQGNVVRKVTVR